MPTGSACQLLGPLYGPLISGVGYAPEGHGNSQPNTDGLKLR